MATVKCILGTVVLFAFLLWTDAGVLKNSKPQLNEKLEQTKKQPAGDIKMTRRGHGGAFRGVWRNIKRTITGRKWPRSSDGNVYVPYVIDDSFSRVAKAAFMMGLVSFHLSTCVRFIPRTNETDHLLIRPSTGCRSFVGLQGGPQPLDLKYPDCFEEGTIHHELLHALGFYHEHNRWDRDRHIRVLWDNIRQRDKGEFKKRLSLNQWTPYAFNSVMHYSRLIGSKNGLPTIKALRDEVEFGTGRSMSPTDVERLNSVYCRKVNRTL